MIRDLNTLRSSGELTNVASILLKKPDHSNITYDYHTDDLLKGFEMSLNTGKSVKVSPPQRYTNRGSRRVRILPFRKNLIALLIKKRGFHDRSLF
jgi:hypothetical protein